MGIPLTNFENTVSKINLYVKKKPKTIVYGVPTFLGEKNGVIGVFTIGHNITFRNVIVNYNQKCDCIPQL